MVAAYREALLNLQTEGIDTGCAALVLLRVAEAGHWHPARIPVCLPLDFGKSTQRTGSSCRNAAPEIDCTCS
jgi:hypothetical protein